MGWSVRLVLLCGSVSGGVYRLFCFGFLSSTALFSGRPQECGFCVGLMSCGWAPVFFRAHRFLAFFFFPFSPCHPRMASVGPICSPCLFFVVPVSPTFRSSFIKAAHPLGGGLDRHWLLRRGPRGRRHPLSSSHHWLSRPGRAQSTGLATCRWEGADQSDGGRGEGPLW